MENLDNRNKLIVKSNSLIESKYFLSVREQKFLIYLASLVNKEDKEYKYTSVRIKDIEAILKTEGEAKWGGIYEVVRELVLSINNKPLSMRKPNGGWRIVNWFSSVDADPGEGRVTFNLSEEIKQQLVRLNEYFTKYRFGNILALKSSYSIRIYELLKLNQFKNKVTYDLGYFRELVGVSYLDENRKWVHKYEEYKAFKRSIINRAQKELKEKTDIYFEIKEHRENRRVKSITFYVFKNKPNKKISQKELFVAPEPAEIFPEENIIYSAEIIDAFVKIGLTDDKGRKVYREGFNMIEDESIRKNIVKNGRSLDEYFLEKVNYVNFQIKNRVVVNPAGLLITAIKENYVSKELEKKKKAKEAQSKAAKIAAEKEQLKEKLAELQRNLWAKEVAVASDLVEANEQFLENLFKDKRVESIIGYKKELTIKDNFNKKFSNFRASAISLIKERFADKFEHLKEEKQKITVFKRKIQQL